MQFNIIELPWLHSLSRFLSHYIVKHFIFCWIICPPNFYIQKISEGFITSLFVMKTRFDVWNQKKTVQIPLITQISYKSHPQICLHKMKLLFIHKELFVCRRSAILRLWSWPTVLWEGWPWSGRFSRCGKTAVWAVWGTITASPPYSVTLRRATCSRWRSVTIETASSGCYIQ